MSRQAGQVMIVRTVYANDYEVSVKEFVYCGDTAIGEYLLPCIIKTHY